MSRLYNGVAFKFLFELCSPSGDADDTGAQAIMMKRSARTSNGPARGQGSVHATRGSIRSDNDASSQLLAAAATGSVHTASEQREGPGSRVVYCQCYGVDSSCSDCIRVIPAGANTCHTLNVRTAASTDCWRGSHWQARVSYAPSASGWAYHGHMRAPSAGQWGAAERGCLAHAGLAGESAL